MVVRFVAFADDIYLKSGYVFRNARIVDTTGNKLRIQTEKDKYSIVSFAIIDHIVRKEVASDDKASFEVYSTDLANATRDGALLSEPSGASTGGDSSRSKHASPDSLYLQRHDEVLVPLDTVDRIESIDEELNLKLRLFPQYRGFTHAYLFQLSDTSFAFEIWSHEFGKTLKSRTLMPEHDVTLLREQISESIHRIAPSAGIDQSGRPTLLGNAYTMSLGLYGWGIPYLLGLNGSAAIGSYLLISAGGILGAQSATENLEVSEETANLSFLGSALGLGHGIMACVIADDGNSSAKTYIATVMALSTAEGIGGYLLGEKLRLNSASVEMIGTMSAAGLLYGYGASRLGDLTRPRSIATSMLIGSVLGTGTGILLIRDTSYTNGDVGVFRGACLLGIYVPLSILGASHVANSKAYIAAAMAGGIIGGLEGNALVSGRDFTTAEGMYIMFGSFGGMLIGGGIPLIVSAPGELAAVLSSVGGLVGYSIMYHRYESGARERATANSLSIQVHPENLLLVAQHHLPPTMNQYAFPFMSLSYRF